MQVQSASNLKFGLSTSKVRFNKMQTIKGNPAGNSNLFKVIGASMNIEGTKIKVAENFYLLDNLGNILKMNFQGAYRKLNKQTKKLERFVLAWNNQENKMQKINITKKPQQVFTLDGISKLKNKAEYIIFQDRSRHHL